LGCPFFVVNHLFKSSFMKYRSLFFLLFLLPVLLSARPLNRSEIVTLGTRAFLQKAQAMYPEALSSTLKDCDYLQNDGEICMAVLHFDRGFLILSAEDAVMPVLAYSFDSDIEVENLAPGVEFFLSQYKEEIAAARRGQIPADEQVANAWQELRHPTRAVTSEVVVSPLLQSKWNQSKYYNYYSPQDPESPGGYDGKVPNGCVAVAMAQIAYYYRYPESGTGSHTNYTYDYGSFYVNFAQQHYCYEAMTDQLYYYNNEVAKLIFHCATAVDMQYGADGSGAYSFNVPNAMSSYFRYNTDSQYRSKHDYSGSEWRQMMKADLDANRPLYYSGYSESGGHAFVCDGYDSDEYFHFNFGWGGSGDGYYLTQSSADDPVHGYGSGQSAIFNLHPLYNDYPTYCMEQAPTAISGSLEDGSSNLDYLNNTNCTYLIALPSQYMVEVTLSSLLTQENHDVLRFWNGHPSQDSLLAEFSGSLTNFSHQFSTDSLYITFETDDSVTDKGWHLTYRALCEGVSCGTHVLHEPSGVITDNSGDGNYLDNSNCYWVIRVSDVASITFTFEEMDISPEDHLDFYDMSYYPYELMASYHGSDNPGSVTYYTNRVKVSFVSDNYLNASGFRVLWSSSAAGVEDYDSGTSVYPNPASEMLHVALTEPLEQCHVSLYDMVGHAVFANGYNNVDHIEIPVGSLTEGLYLLAMENQGKTTHWKIVVRH